MKVHKFYIRIQARYVPEDSTIYKDAPDPRSRKRLIPYILTNKISFYSDENREVVQYAKKMLYLIDPEGKISFIAPEIYVSVGFDDISSMYTFLEGVKKKGG